MSDVKKINEGRSESEILDVISKNEHLVPTKIPSLDMQKYIKNFDLISGYTIGEYRSEDDDPVDLDYMHNLFDKRNENDEWNWLDSVEKKFDHEAVFVNTLRPTFGLNKVSNKVREFSESYLVFGSLENYLLYNNLSKEQIDLINIMFYNREIEEYNP